MHDEEHYEEPAADLPVCRLMFPVQNCTVVRTAQFVIVSVEKLRALQRWCDTTRGDLSLAVSSWLSDVWPVGKR